MSQWSVSGARPLSTSTVIGDHAERIRRNPSAFATTLLRSRSGYGRDILAHLASGGSAHTDEVLEAAASRGLRRLGRDVEPELLGQLARVLALQGPSPDSDAALTLFEAIWEEYGHTSMRERDLAVYLQLLQSQRRRSTLVGRLRDTRVDPSTYAALMADLSSPVLYPEEGGRQDEWLQRLTAALGINGTISLRDGNANPFDRLTSSSTECVEYPQKITVITSAYNPDASLLNAAKSLIAQSWQNWEMLVVDDASTSPSAESVLQRVESLDSRIRVIRKAVNGGTYRARNTALLQARGDFVTCLDSDDWAHPDRLLRGVEPLLESPAILATRSLGARVSPSLEVTRPGYRTLFPAASSLMFRLQPVVGRIGFFEPVRKGADTEYARRIEVAFGTSIVDVSGGAYTLLRADDSSLSSAEFSSGWRHPVRWAYKQSYGMRHRAIRSHGADAFIEPERQVDNFGIERWQKTSDLGRDPRKDLDIVVAGDWRRFGGPQISMLEEIRALRHAGWRVGVLHIEAMRFFTQQDEPLCEPLRELLAERKVTLVHLDDPLEVPLLLLRYPPILQFPPRDSSAIRPKKLRIVANQAPAERDGTDQRYVPSDVHRNAEELFGVEPRWVPQSPNIRRVLEPLLPESALADWDNPAIIDLDAWWSPRAEIAPEAFTVGRFSRDDVIKFPQTGAQLLAAYGFKSPAKVVMMGARTQVKRLLADDRNDGLRVPDNWTLLPHKAMPVQKFLSELDAVVYMDHPQAHEAFGRSLLESAASGRLVVASPKHRANFGDALVYAEPEEAVATVERYLSDPKLLREQLERCRAAVSERWSPDAFIRRILAELPARRDVPPSSDVTPGARPGTVTIKRSTGQAPRLWRRGSRGIETSTVRVRRFADGESSDHLVVIHTDWGRRAAIELSRDIIASRRPGAAIALPSELPVGVLGLVWDDGGAWVTSLAREWQVTTDDTWCCLRYHPSCQGSAAGTDNEVVGSDTESWRN